MPAPSTRWPRACCSSGSVAPPGCSATSASSRRRTRRPDGWARRRTRWTRTARSCGRPRSTCRSPSVERACASLVGESMQTPPAYSAVKVGGRRLYEAARRGEVLEAPARPIRVDAFAVSAFDGRDLEALITCSGGTYVRVLVADVGRSLGCGAHLVRLRRTAIGSFRVEDARPPGEGTLAPRRARRRAPAEDPSGAGRGSSGDPRSPARTRGDRGSLRGVRSGRRTRRHLSGRGTHGEARGDPPKAVRHASVVIASQAHGALDVTS